MNPTPFNVAIIGAGPAGASLASQLSGAGVEVLLFHSPGTVEKHCGGGIPSRALDEFTWLHEQLSPCKEIRRITLMSPGGISHDLELTHPMITVSRAEFDEGLRQRAIRSGARLLNERVRSLRRDGRRWKICTETAEYGAAFLVGADGVASLVRRTLSERFSPCSLSLCAGYYITPPDEERIVIGFLKRRAAYSWIFPRPGLASAGIVAPLGQSNRNTLLGELRAWLDGSFPDFKFDYSRPYSALISTYPGACPSNGSRRVSSAGRPDARRVDEGDAVRIVEDDATPQMAGRRRNPPGRCRLHRVSTLPRPRRITVDTPSALRLDPLASGWRTDRGRAHYSDRLLKSPVSGDGWALIGDAAGVADPIAREGIYFSLKSAEILASAYLSNHPEYYGKRLASFLAKSHRAALFLSKHLFTPFFTERAVRRARKNSHASRAMENFFSDRLDYGRLGRGMFASLVRG